MTDRGASAASGAVGRGGRRDGTVARRSPVDGRRVAPVGLGGPDGADDGCRAGTGDRHLLDPRVPALAADEQAVRHQGATATRLALRLQRQQLRRR